MKVKLPSVVCLAVALVACIPTRSLPHELPVSSMMIVADEDVMHVELVINTAELAFFSELDRDKNGVVGAAELAAKGDQVAHKIVECFAFQIDGQPVVADVCGVVPEPNTHHLKVRAHYRGDARCAPIFLTSTLTAITQRSHVIEAVCSRPTTRQAARLDARHPSGLFGFDRTNDVAKAPCVDEPTGLAECQLLQHWILLLVGLGVSLVCLLFLINKR